jgi:hypothetical protein
VRIFLYHVILLASAPLCFAQTTVDMTKVCEGVASSSGQPDAESVANIRATCLRAVQCASSCNSFGDDVESFTECIQKCAFPEDENAAKLNPAKQSKDDEGEKGNLCKQAGEFRDHQLFQLWDTEQRKYAIFTKGGSAQVTLRDNTRRLLDDEWWAGSTGSEVAIAIKGFADVFSDSVSLFVPEGEAIQIGTDAIHHAREIADGVTVIGELVTYAKENAEAAAKQATVEVFAKYGGQLGSGTKLLLDTAEYANRKKDAEEYREIVQGQVRRINETLKGLDEKRKAAVEKMEAYQEVVSGIDMICASKRSTPDVPASAPAPPPN